MREIDKRQLAIILILVLLFLSFILIVRVRLDDTKFIAIENVEIRKNLPFQGKDQYLVSYTIKNGKNEPLNVVVKVEIGVLVISGFGSFGQNWRSFQPFTSKIDEIYLKPGVARTVSTKILVSPDASIFPPESIVKPRVTVAKVSK